MTTTTWRFALPILFAGVATLSLGYAQDDPPARQPGRATQPATGTVTEGDRVLATWIASANNNEIQLAQAAQQSAQNPEVKQFAQMMIKDHGEFGRKLQKFAAGMPGETNGNTGRTGERTGAGEGERTGAGERTAAGRPADASGSRRPGAELNYVSLVQELCRKHLESAKKVLEGKQGAEYDRCYMQMQVMAHVHVLDKLQVFGNHASPELRSVFEEAQPTVRSHLDKAKDIAKRLETGTGGTGDRK